MKWGDDWRNSKRLCLCGVEESSEQGEPVGMNDRGIVLGVCSIVWFKCTVFEKLSSEP